MFKRTHFPSSITLESEDGTKVTFLVDEDNDIIIFLDDVRSNPELASSLDVILKDPILLSIFSSHRVKFKYSGFEKRAVLYLSEEINERALDYLIQFYETKIKFNYSLISEHFVVLRDVILTLVAKSIINFPEDVIMELKNIPLPQLLKEKRSSAIIREHLENTMKELLENMNEREKRRLTKYLLDITYGNLDLFSASYLLPSEIIKLMKENLNKSEKLDYFKDTLIKTRIAYPLFSIYICDNTDSHDFYSNPPYHFITIPHSVEMNSPISDLRCPKCGSDLKKALFLGFIPPISKRIMKKEGFFPYLIAYFLASKDITFYPNVKAEDSEFDFLIKWNKKQILVEVKCLIRKTREDEIKTSILEAINQIKRSIEKQKKQIKIDKVFIVINYDKETLSKIIKKQSPIQEKLNKMGIKFSIIGYDQLNEMIKELKGE